MSAKLRVEELRVDLQRRGLDASGTKPVLVRRLDAAIRKEGKEAASAAAAAKASDVDGAGSVVMDGKGDTENKRKRKKRAEGQNDQKNDMSCDADAAKLGGMGYCDLQALAKAHELNANGGKKDVTERLLSTPAYSVAVVDGEVQDKNIIANGGDRKVEDEVKNEKLITDVLLDASKLEGMGYRDLQALAKTHGHNVNGGKKDVIQRLLSTPCYSVPVAHGEVQDKNIVADGGGDRKAEEEVKDEKMITNILLDVSKLEGMGYRELQALAKARGLVANGTKKDVIERLLSALANPAAVVDGGVQDKKKKLKGDDGKVEEEVKKEKMVTATKKGAAVLDQHIPDNIKMTYHVLQVGDEIYDATMNQTNVGNNNNKFYVIQVLESDAGGSFMVYNRWGRVGARGQDKLHGPFQTRDKAIFEFEGKFEEKTYNCWSDRKNFKCYEKKYTWLEMDYGEADKGTNNPQKKSSIADPIKETQLDTRIAHFISLICNVSMMKQQMMEIGYNADKLPLGKLSKSTILKGYDVLKRISNVISRANRSQLEQLTGEFYTVIPHDFGFRKMREFIIDTPQKLKAKLEMVEALGEIEIATKLLEDDSSDQDDPLHARYMQLRCDFTPLEVGSQEYSMGLRIAPPEAPVTGYMFGKGVYFADMFSKSANYCYASGASRSGVLLLCEVALGDMNELLNADYDANNLPKGKLSTKGVGQIAPNIVESKITDDGVVVPLGKPKEEPSKRGSLLYNEYIVYNVDQIRMRYVLHVSFNFKR